MTQNRKKSGDKYIKHKTAVRLTLSLADGSFYMECLVIGCVYQELFCRLPDQ